MLFASSIFLFLFLPLFLGIYYVTPFRWRSLVILLGSYTFYGWWRIDFMVLFAAVTAFNYVISKYMVRHVEGQKWHKRWLFIGIAGNLLVLGYFKYFNFGVDSLNALLVGMGSEPMTLWSVILPIGISFYIFQAASYLIDVYRGEVKVASSFLDFAAFIALFPQLIAGPVLRYKDVEDQFTSRTHTLDKFNEGVMRFACGFCKKVLIADTIAPVADAAFALENPSLMDSWIGILAYAAQLYFDFSGYSDMAIGLGLMMGFRFMENFNHPYISRSITEFWRRWHISLSTWLRDYLYIPLGGNRKGEVRTYVNLFLTMLLGGFWHGANWTFVFWGMWHGGILAFERLIGGKKELVYPKLIAWPLTLLLVLIGWVMFRAPTMSVAIDMYKGMLGMHATGLSDTLAWRITPLEITTLILAYGFIAISPVVMRMKYSLNNTTYAPYWGRHVGVLGQLLLVLLFILAITKLITDSFSPFLYFQF